MMNLPAKRLVKSKIKLSMYRQGSVNYIFFQRFDTHYLMLLYTSTSFYSDRYKIKPNHFPAFVSAVPTRLQIESEKSLA